MKYVNNTLHGVKVPVKNGSYPVHWVTFKIGEEKELEDRASNAAELLGLTKVCEECKKPEVEAETKTVHKKNKVETKKVKKRS